MKCTTHLLVFIFIVTLSMWSGTTLLAQVAQQDSLALVALYNSTDGPNWSNHDNWLSGPVATWYGVTVTGDRVTSLDLTDNNLSGTLPAEIGDLTQLQVLALYRNNLTGLIPAEIGGLTALTTLGLSRNQLEGPIPAEIGNLTQLRGLYLDENRLSGAIPAEIGNLRLLARLSLSHNQLIGEIPAEIGSLGNLQYLYLSHNQLSGAIPGELSLLTKLINLDLASNLLSDTVRVNFAGLKKLETMNLRANELVGALPVSLDSLPKLQQLDVDSNRFVDLPDLSRDTSLTVLRIQNNRFTFEDIEPNVWVETFYYSPQDSVGEEQDTTLTAGQPLEFSVSVGGTANLYQWMKDGADIPGATENTYTIDAAGASDVGSYVCRITNTIATRLTLYSRPIQVTVSGLPNLMVQDSLALVALYDSTDGANWTHHDNWLSGPVSTWYGVTVAHERVRELDLNHNNLAGPIPPEIGELTALQSLVLNGNQLSGVIPPEIGSLVGLTNLTLWTNQLEGSIPAEISHLTQLQTLNLSQNRLSGPIPPEIGALTNLQTLYLYINQLSGPIPQEIFGLTSLQYLNLYNNQLTGPIPPEIGNLDKLRTCNLSMNQLSGAIPAEIGNLVQLQILSLSSDQLTGSIPAEIGNLTNLQYLYLSNNQFSGPIPPSIGGLTKLTRLELHENQFSGIVPRELEQLTNLVKLALSWNDLSDTIKVNFAKMKKLQWLWLSDNDFSGPAPVGLDSLPELKELKLQSNHFVDLPDLSADTSLTDLYLQNNRFTFEDIEPNLWVEKFYYSPQDSVGQAVDTTVDVGSSLELSVSVGGTANQYQWSKDGEDIAGADSSVYIITSAGAADSGTYICRITNTIATELTLYSKPMHVRVGGGTEVARAASGVPGEFKLHQNYPNPFNPTTTIAFDVPQATNVELTIFDTMGREVAALVNEKYQPGKYEATFDAGHLASGVYFYRIRMGDFQQTRKMMLVR